ncbi:MAG TPA: HD domain-containing phosphohydrolase [Spirochaetia bacterium]|nr:HD domain-containing phosphohydrolase [Spirochaetia bacterium]
MMRTHNLSRNMELEAAFREETRQRVAHDTRWGVLNTLFMYPIFIPLDFLVYPSAAPTFVWIRFSVVALSIAVHFIMQLPFPKQHARYFGIFAYLYCTLSIVIMVHLVNGYASPYYAGINLVLIAFLFILPMNVWETAIVCAIVYAAYIVPITIRGGIDNQAVFVANNFFLVSTMVLVVTSSYLAMTMRRKEFTSRFELAHANEELKVLDVVKSQFFASISHEVRTPLTSIMAPIDSLHREDVGPLSSAQRSLIGQVRRNSLRLLDLINQMLDFAKFDAKKMKLHLKQVDMVRVVRDQVTLFQEVCRRKGLGLTYDVPTKVPVVYLDFEKVERIVANLIRNAVKFTENGSISIEVTQTEQRTIAPGADTKPESAGSSATDESDAPPVTGWIVVRVRDTGIGIAERDVKKVFQRFHQIDRSTTRRYEGTGLGLTIVQESVDLQHGQVWVESTEGVGSTFTVQLPMNLDEIETEADIDRRQDDRRQEAAEFDGLDRRHGPRRNEDYERISVGDIAFIESESVSDDDVVPQIIPPTKPSTGIRVLYVEDNTDLRNYVGRMLRSFGHTVATAIDGTSGWSQTQELLPDIVVSDVMMPGLDGFELVRLVKTTKATQKIPIVLITAKSETDSRIEGLEIGADDYLAKPIDIRDLDARINNIVAARNFRDALTRAEELEVRVEQLAQSLSRSLELRDGYTAGHSDDVRMYGTIIAEELGIPLSRRLRESLLLHDIGKLGIPDALLRKPGPLTPDEWEIMRRHPQMGADLLRQFDSLEEIGNIVFAHHEHYDGSGYPRGIAGEEIPIEARIISIADAWHAMCEDRTYRRAIPIKDAISELRKNRGRQFDPEIVERFLAGLVRRGLLPESLVLEL